MPLRKVFILCFHHKGLYVLLSLGGLYCIISDTFQHS